MRIELVDNLDAFGRLEPEWNGLLHGSASDSPFLTWEWLHTWWRHLAGSRRLRIATVRDGGSLVAVAPLAIARHAVPWLSRLEFLGTGLAGSDYLDLIARRGLEGDCVRELGRALRSQRCALRLDHAPTASLAGVLASELRGCNWTVMRSPSDACPFATLAGHTWDTYLETLAASHRTRFRRYLNTLRKKFTVSFELAASERSRRDALAALIAFHRARWGARGGSTAFATSALRDFHEDVTGRALASGWLRLHVLRLDDVPAAVTYCFGYNSRFYLYQHGFNDRYRHYSVGLVALGLTIRAALEERALEFDMLYGREPYKWLWAKEEHGLERLDLFPADIAGRVHRRGVEAVRTLRALARRILARRACSPNIPTAGVVS
jgi:CelD/BcsL family acetyltransferase involved in cellulose biosynthesis